MIGRGAWRQLWLATPHVNGVNIEGDSHIVDTTDIVEFSRLVAPLSQDVNARLMELKPLDEDLESVFRYLVAR